jgi:hypothetical protein
MGAAAAPTTNDAGERGERRGQLMELQPAVLILRAVEQDAGDDPVT